MRIRFLSKNEHKIHEAATILAPFGVEVTPVSLAIAELQADNMSAIVRDKTLRAFAKLGHPLFVEQTGLRIDRINGFPGGLTQVFWDTIGPDRVCSLFGQGDDVGVLAITRIGYCDGRRIHEFEGSIRGRIASEPRGNRAFQWDCVFVPDGYEETFAEMGERKNDISMRRNALNAFAKYLQEHANA
jgi:XTP/dITP diphosphohydrolase